MLTLVSAGLTVSLRAGEVALGTLAPQPVHEVLADVEATFRYLGRDAAHEAGEHFDAMLSRLAQAGELKDAAEEGQDIATKLLVIATHRRDNLHLYETIRSSIVEAKVSERLAAWRAQPLSPWAWSVEYRLVWEYFLMRPPSRARGE